MSKTTPVTVFISLGSNIEPRKDNIIRAMDQIAQSCGPVVSRSMIYRTEAWGDRKLDYFLNCVISIETALGPFSLFNRLMSIERNMGRTEKGNMKPRSIDLDILYYDSEVIRARDLTVPHERLHLRRFNLVPLAEIAPGFMHPVFRRTQSELLRECDDSGEVTVFADN